MTAAQTHTDSAHAAGARGDAHGYDPNTSGNRLFFGRGRRTPAILQTEAAECGLACLAMIAGHHGHHATLPALRRRFSLSLKGITATRLIEMADALGLQCRPLRLEMDEIGQLQTPCIAHWDLDHFVLLQQVRKRHIVILDPASGERRLSHEECARHFTGVALELSKGPTFQRKRPEPPVSLRTLAGSVHGLGNRNRGNRNRKRNRVTEIATGKIATGTNRNRNRNREERNRERNRDTRTQPGHPRGTPERNRDTHYFVEDPQPGHPLFCRAVRFHRGRRGNQGRFSMAYGRLRSAGRVLPRRLPGEQQQFTQSLFR